MISFLRVGPRLLASLLRTVYTWARYGPQKWTCGGNLTAGELGLEAPDSSKPQTVKPQCHADTRYQIVP